MSVVLLMAMSMGANAQGILDRIADRAVNRAVYKAESEAERGLNKAADKVFSKKKKKDKKSKDEDEEEQEEEKNSKKTKKATVATTTDFKRGSVILFQDDITAEQVGEFPSKWDLISGNAETKTLDDIKAIEITNDGCITPLIEKEGAYLPEEFTLEYEFYYWEEKEDIGLNDLKIILATSTDRTVYPDYMGENMAFSLLHGVSNEFKHSYHYNGDRDGEFEYEFSEGWHKVAISFNKRALKVYFDGNRVVNLPRVNQPKWFCFQVPFDYHDLIFIRNIVLAKGAVALYDRNSTDLSAMEKAIAETGKFVTNNILFDTGKATLKAESMAEIQKVADYMKANPSVRFEVQGHTDNQGSDKINDPLSQERAEAIVKALVGMGCDEFNLRAVGKGSHEPVADNGTEAGRTQNRRVVFVKK